LVLFAVFLSSLLWSILGAFIGVPAMIAILAVGEEFPQTR